MRLGKQMELIETNVSETPTLSIMHILFPLLYSTVTMKHLHCGTNYSVSSQKCLKK